MSATDITFRPAESARIGAMTRRIVAAYAAATADDLAHGLAWYDRAQAAAANIAAATGTTVETAAGIIAALSPRCRWATNVAWAMDVASAAAEGRPCPSVHTQAMRAQAWRIANGEPALSVLNGPKVRSFFRNITGDHDAVTVDVWAVRVAIGRTAESGDLPTGRRYAIYARAYANAAAILNVAPRTVQAAVWVAIRGAAD